MAVLDVESVPDGDALSQAPRHSAGGHARPALHRIVSATVLVCDEHPNGFADVDLRTFAHPELDETSILGCVDLLLPDPAEGSSRLVTWNGGHDLRLLRQRACSNWMFGVRALAGWCGGAAGSHVDVMERFACGDRRAAWRLADACAGLGFAVRNGLSARPVLTLHSRGRHDAVAEHNRLDVVGTFLAYAYHRSFETGDDGFAATAWTGIADVLEGVAGVDPNVQSLAGHHLVSVARGRLTGPHPGPARPGRRPGVPAARAR
ncbi:hypothetical protein KX816_04500 [Sphingosinicellaceae bacterium]|nr:hypothetical protein KX816_04500 [Sphingosinicellaceae bacterium]